MTWLFWQSWLLLLVSFLLGAFLTWLFLVRPRRGAVAAGAAESSSADPVGSPSRPEPAAADRPARGSTTATESAAASTSTAVAEPTPTPTPQDTEHAPERATERAPETEQDAKERATSDGIVVRPRTKTEAAADERVVTMAGSSDDYDDTVTPAHGFPVPRHAEAARVTGRVAGRTDGRAAGRAADRSEDAGGSDDADTVVIDADIAAGRHAKPVESPDFEGGVLPRGDGGAPTGGYVIKARTDSMLYHAPGSPAYRYAKADVWFRDAESAEDAGFRPWNWRDRAIARRSDGAATKAATATTAAPSDAPAASTNGRTPTNGRVRNGTRRNLEEGAYPGSVKAVDGGAAPSDEFVVKASEDSMLYHTAESPAFASTRAEIWFRSEADARRAGFAPWRNLR